MDLDAVEALSLRTLGSSDAVTIGDLTGTGLKRTAVDLGANGGGGDGSTDTVVANGTGRRDNVDVSRVGDQVVTTGLPSRLTISGSEGLNDTLRLNTLGGDDKVTVDPDAELLLTPVIDLGADE